jgi:hypothetical protein
MLNPGTLRVRLHDTSSIGILVGIQILKLEGDQHRFTIPTRVE